MTGPGPGAAADATAGRASLELADWRRRIAALYAEVRERGASDPRAAWDHWRAIREALYREHPQSPVPAAARGAFRSHHWPYEPSLRFEVAVEVADSGAVEPAGGFGGEHGVAAAGAMALVAPLLPMSAGERIDVGRIGRVTVPFPAGTRMLDVFWMAGYAGGIFLPFRDATNGSETYGAGRYLLDGAKGADLGGSIDEAHLVLDFNFAFQPSCAFDPRWACPLAPAENRLDLRIEAGERLR